MSDFVTFQAVSTWLGSLIGVESVSLDDVLNLNAFSTILKKVAPEIIFRVGLDGQLPKDMKTDTARILTNIRQYVNGMAEVVKENNELCVAPDTSFVKCNCIAEYFNSCGRDSKGPIGFIEPLFHQLNLCYGVANYLVALTFIALSVAKRKLNSTILMSLSKLPRVHRCNVESVLLKVRKYLGVKTGFIPEDFKSSSLLSSSSASRFAGSSRVGESANVPTRFRSHFLNTSAETNNQQSQTYRTRYGEEGSLAASHPGFNPGAIEVKGESTKDDIKKIIEESAVLRQDLLSEFDDKRSTAPSGRVTIRGSRLEELLAREEASEIENQFGRYQMECIASRYGNNLAEQVETTNTLFASTVHEDIEARKFLESQRKTVKNGTEESFIVTTRTSSLIQKEELPTSLIDREGHEAFERKIYDDYRRSINGLIEGENARSRIVASGSALLATRVNDDVGRAGGSKVVAENFESSRGATKTTGAIALHSSSTRVVSFVDNHSSRVGPDSPFSPEKDERVESIRSKIAETNARCDNLRGILLKELEKKNSV